MAQSRIGPKAVAIRPLQELSAFAYNQVPEPIRSGYFLLMISEIVVVANFKLTISLGTPTIHYPTTLGMG